MRSTRWTASCSTIALAIALCASVGLLADPPPTERTGAATEAKQDSSDTDSGEKVDDAIRVSVETARERAKLAHGIYSATLDVIHHRYFHGDRATVPARALEEVFPRVNREHNLKARWFAVNAKAMSVDHEQQDEFEKQAAKAIAAGDSEYEQIADGIYRRAGAISLMNKGCLGCHLGFGASGKIKRFAALSISIPVKEASVNDVSTDKD